jgi:ubiquinone/menaquinone biosynthesis C-methylase UbiE
VTLAGAGVLRHFILFVFRLLYYELAFTYDLVAWTVSMGQWRAWQRSALPFLRGGRVLEVGHGTGDLLLDLAARGLRPVGLDLSPRMGALAHRKLRRRLGPGSARPPLVRGSVEALPFAGGAVLSIVSTFPSDYIARPAAIAEFHRVLAPGGVLVAVPAAQITGLAVTDRFADWLFRVTGQAAPGVDVFAPFLDRYRAAGFSPRVERVRLPRSVVTVIVAEKDDDGRRTNDDRP